MIGVPDAKSGEVPKAFVQLRQPSQTISASELIDFTCSNLSEFKRIAELEFVDLVPVSASGKILRRVLRAAEMEKRKL